jgi:hypothetical protein
MAKADPAKMPERADTNPAHHGGEDKGRIKQPQSTGANETGVGSVASGIAAYIDADLMPCPGTQPALAPWVPGLAGRLLMLAH